MKSLYLFILCIILLLIMFVIIFKMMRDRKVMSHNLSNLLKGFWYCDNNNYDIYLLYDEVLCINIFEGNSNKFDEIIEYEKTCKKEDDYYEEILTIDSSLGNELILRNYYDNQLYVIIDDRFVGKFTPA